MPSKEPPNPMPDEPAPHPLIWDEAMVQRFWDFAATAPAYAQEYFTQQVGAGLAACARRLMPTLGLTLDFGCGPGFLAQHLLRAGVPCVGCDASPTSVAETNRRNAGHPLWRGATASTGMHLPFADGSIDLVIASETIEHLLPHQLPVILSEWRRVMIPRTGRLLVTTPHQEDLALGEVCCPACGGTFHRFQHLRSLDRTSLGGLLAEHGFRERLCTTTDFRRFQPPDPGRGIRSLVRRGHAAWRGLHRRCLDATDRLRAASAPIGGRWLQAQVGSGPHLFWFGGAS
jgi:SAM-dependent methyltransferase